MSKGKVYAETYGCQMNVLDNELVLGRLVREGYELARDEREADVILLNTCAVREHAEEKVYARAGRLQLLKRRRPEVVIGIVGCMAQNHQGRILERAPHVDLVCGPRHLGKLPRLIDEVRERRVPRVVCEDHDEEFVADGHLAGARPTPFQAYVKVVEGCGLSCTFCIVPRVRGPEVSRPPDEIVDEVRCLAGEGVIEVTLLGQTVDSYGQGLSPRVDLGGLLARVHGVPGLRRLRFVTSHPSFVRRSLVEAMRDLPKVCPYLHFPAQAGSDATLRRMRRGYTVARYLAVVEELRAEVPGIELASDFIVGFPGETDEDFQGTVDLVSRVRFQGAFVFKYSPRPGTEAAGALDDVPPEAKRRRHQALLDVQKRISLEKNRSRIGSVEEVLVEGPSKADPERWTGRTPRHQVVVFAPAGLAPGTFARVRVEDATATTLYGTALVGA